MARSRGHRTAYAEEVEARSPARIYAGRPRAVVLIVGWSEGLGGGC